MRILVFGKAGQVARALRARLGDDRAVFAGHDRLDLAAEDADVAALIAAERPDAVINASAYNAVDRAETDWLACHRLNAAAPARMGAACQAADIPFVHFSTDYVFDGEKGAPYDEDDVRRPLCAYARAKAEGEAALEQLMERGARLAFIRTSRVFSGKGTGFLQTMLRLAREREALQVVADQVACPTPADACADAALRLTELMAGRAGAGVGRYHAAGADAVSWAGLAEMIFAASARRGGPTARVEPIAASAFPTPAARPKDSRLACARLVAATSWRSPSLAEAIDRAVAVELA